MANEIKVTAMAGLMLSAQLMLGSAAVGASVALTEPTPGYYLGSVPGGTAAGDYVVTISNGSAVIASARMLWDGTAEVAPGAASTAPTAAENAAAVRTNLATELGRMDVAVSTRAAPGAAMTLTAGERTTLAAQIEAALLADGDGQAFVNAIVAAIGNVNVNQAVFVAAIRADLERAGGLLDVLPTLTEIEASAILAKQAQVTAIRAKTDLLPAAPAAVGDIPTAATVAAAVRTNLTTELGRMDVAVSTRESEANAATRAATNQTEHDATQAAVAGMPATLRADIERTGGMLDLVPTAVEMASAIAAIGDPLTRPVPGTYPAGSAGEALGRLVVPGSPEDPVIVIPAPPNDVSTCRVYGYVEGPDNRRIVNAKVKVVLLPRDTAVASNRLIAGREVQLSTNSEGRIMGPTGDPWVDLQRNDLLLPAGSFYEVTSAELGVSRKQVTLTTTLADLRALLLAA